MKFTSRLSTFSLLIFGRILSVCAQYLPLSTFPETLVSKLDPAILIQYKQPDAGTCQTAFETQKQYTGYIYLPPGILAPVQQNYDIHTFFWFIEARQSVETAPLTIWLNGGPGSSSMIGLFTEMGPCKVIQAGDGTYGTQSNPWGWDRSSNMLFIDQPNQVGFSFDTPTNATYDFYTQQLADTSATLSNNVASFMFRNGTFSNIDSKKNPTPIRTANTTEIAARAVWHFLQTWLDAFPQYNPAVRPNSTATTTGGDPVGINLFAESYGGKYGPAFAAYFEDQNAKRANGQLPLSRTLEIKLESVGIINGIIDDRIQIPFYPAFAYNNTYGIQAISNVDYLNTMQMANSSSSTCLSQIDKCRAAMASTDPEGFGDNDFTNLICAKAQEVCRSISAPYYNNGYNPYDIRQKLPTPDPPAAYQEDLNSASVLQAIGAMGDYTESTDDVQKGFISTGDSIRGGLVDDLANLLSKGIRVALIYGDADYICNWYGGQEISLAIASRLRSYPSANGQSPYATSFPAAGYAEIVVNDTYIGGAVRQYGNLSFNRIYDAGHFVPYFQPETAFTVFSRIIEGNDIATGNVTKLISYASNGTSISNHTNTVPTSTAAPTCWLRSWRLSCSVKDNNAMLSGKGLVMNGIFYQDPSLVSLPQSSITAASPGRPLSHNQTSSYRTSSIALTGVYTATSTPKGSEGHSLRQPLSGPSSAISASLLGLLLGVAIVM